MKKGITKGKRCFLLWVIRLMAVIIAFCMIILFKSSFITVESTDSVYQDFITPVERSTVSFENSSLFHDILYDEVCNISRMCVIRNQLEENNTYQAKKRIEINSFANRSNVSYEDQGKVEYYLDDLIKWGNYGFDYKKVNEAAYGWGSDNISIMISRYLSADGKELAEYAPSLAEYEELETNLQSAAESLFQNYTEYSRFNKLYADDKTNMIYCYRFIVDGNYVYYTNLDSQLNLKNMSADDITAEFAKYNKFIAYNPDKMQISTNTGMNASTMRNILSSYEYSFTDNSRVWIGVDNTYKAADILQKANYSYEERIPYFWTLVMVTGIAGAIFILAFFMVLFFEGRVIGKDGAFLRYTFDKIPLEALLLFFAGAFIGAGFIMKLFWQSCIEKGVIGYTAVIFFTVFIFICVSIFMGLLLSMVRKMKDKTFFKNSLFYLICKKIRSAVLETYDNGQLVTRTWLPYLLFLCINLVLVLLGTAGILIAFVFDIVVGIYEYHENKERQKIIDGIEHIKSGEFSYKTDTKELHGDNLILANSVNSIGESIRLAVETSMKDERLKADLITNVSHDIKTPLTSIINYVDLLKRERIENDRVNTYIAVLEQKSQRLKQLTDDLVEASKISSGNIVLHFERINFVELIHQSFGEFAEKFEEKNLTVVENLPKEPVYIQVDSRRIFRVIENLYNNIYKYALAGTRVYVDMNCDSMKSDSVTLSIKNISAQSLNVNADELTERFIRGDVSRNTEGSGLGLSIAKNLTQAQNGEFEIILDGDLFKVLITFMRDEEK